MFRLLCTGCLTLCITVSYYASEPSLDTEPTEPLIPEVIYFFHGGYDTPIFVSTSSMVNADGFPNEEFPTYAEVTRDLHQAAETDLSPCLNPMSSVEFETGTDSRRDLQTAIKSSDVVLVASITARSPGFLHNDIAGTLYRFNPIEVLRGQHQEGELYFFIPIGHFDLGRISICKSHPDYAEPPAVDEQVMLIYNDHWYNASGIVFTGGSTGVVTLKNSGHASLPRRFRKHSNNPELLLNESLKNTVRGFLREEQ